MNSSLEIEMSRPTLLVAPLAALMLIHGAAIGATPPGETGAQEWGFRQVWITDQMMQRTFIVSVYYPAEEQGTQAPLDPSLGPYPGVAFGHGFTMTRKRYDFYGRHLATHGYVIVLLNFTDLNNARQRSELSACLTWLEEQNSDSGSWLFGAIDDEHFAVAGHSMGGGVAVQVAGEDARVDACAPLAPGTTAQEMSAVSVPVMILAGDRDQLIPIDDLRASYGGATPPSSMVTILGGNHNQFMDVSYFWEDLFDGNPTISRTEQQRLTNLYSTAHFGYYLKGVGEYRSYLHGYRGGADPGIDRDADSGEALDLLIEPAALEVSRGKELQFTVTITNREAGASAPSVRTLVRFGGQTRLDPALGPFTVPLEPGETRVVSTAQSVPETAPEIEMDYAVMVEEGALMIEDSFAATVVPGR